MVLLEQIRDWRRSCSCSSSSFRWLCPPPPPPHGTAGFPRTDDRRRHSEGAHPIRLGQRAPVKSKRQRNAMTMLVWKETIKEEEIISSINRLNRQLNFTGKERLERDGAGPGCSAYEPSSASAQLSSLSSSSPSISFPIHNRWSERKRKRVDIRTGNHHLHPPPPPIRGLPVPVLVPVLVQQS